MPNFRRIIAQSQHPLAELARRVYWGVNNFSLPLPMVLVRPLVTFYYLLNGIYRFFKRVFIAEPFFKAQCRRFGRNVHTGIFLHWITGKGDFILGNDILIDGKCSFGFAARFADRPTLEIGDGSDIGHGCQFTVAKKVTIGKHCMIAGGVWIFDSSGHSTDPASRLANLPPDDGEVKPVVIGDNVWIGRQSKVFPGVTIGDGSVVASGSVVMSDVPAYAVVAGNPARKIASLTPPPAAAASPLENNTPVGTTTG